MKYTRFTLLLGAFILLVGCHKHAKETYTGIAEGKVWQVPSMTGGKIIKLYVEEGDSIQKNCLIAQLEPTDYQIQKSQLQGIIAEIQAQKQVQSTTIAQAKKDLAYQGRREKRNELLFKNDNLPLQTMDDIQNTRQKSESLLLSAQQQLAILLAKQEQVQAQIMLLDKKVSDTNIYAPESGTISTLYYEQGEAVPPVKPVVELMNTHNIEVSIYVGAEKLPFLKTTQPVIVSVDGYPHPLRGAIEWISNKAEFSPKQILTPETRKSLVYCVRIRIENNKGIIKHGMPVEIQL